MKLHTALQKQILTTVLSPDTLTYGENPAIDSGPEWPSLLVNLGSGQPATRKPQ
ncbi:hypothetical protein [Mycobacterium lepromatosis]|uniref:hypothetical protein n=1 Tax=Mycobacterium lepromatosis TaxID=480418 RepID=UPI000B2D7CBE|nr:hypothetical protein [Mycobacterium lepromatosis]